jgi:hypothetical protein
MTERQADLFAGLGARAWDAPTPQGEDCRRFAGFGIEQPLPEQIAASQALGAIGGADAAASVAHIVVRVWVQGPTLATAVAVAPQRLTRRRHQLAGWPTAKPSVRRMAQRGAARCWG